MLLPNSDKNGFLGMQPKTSMAAFFLSLDQTRCPHIAFFIWDIAIPAK
jgi:hypothetical protein